MLILEETVIENSNFVFSDVQTSEIVYNSDNLEITGYIHRPKALGKFPVVICNRGGNRNLGTHTLNSFDFQREIASNGYVVLSSQLRGNKYSQGVDEMGGKDLNDILKLIEIAKDLDYADEGNIGAYGISRGGMNTYQLSRLTDQIKAIAVVGAPVDPRIDFGSRPEMYEKVYYPLVGDTLANKEAYDYRSPIKWVDKINEPTLILHGLDDWRVTPKNAELMIAEMKRLNKKFDYELFEGGDHGLSTHFKQRNLKVIDWFNRYLKQDEL